MEIVSFERGHVEEAASLLAAGHPADLATIGTPAVAAVDGGVLTGFMAATVSGFPAHPTARIRMRHHAAAPGKLRQTYRHLYRALSGQLTRIGCFEHSIAVAAAHADTVTCLFELGFGIDQVKGTRPLTPLAAPDARLREARADDLPHLLHLTLELLRFHAEAPVLRPALIDLDAIGDDFLAAIADPRRLLLLAEVDDRPAGLMVTGPDSHLPGTTTIGLAAVTAAVRSRGLGTAMLSGVVDWARRNDFHACGAEWTSANLISDAFWRGHGFTPVRYTLARRIDPRVAWAGPELTYP